jgi:hypothetical protein
MVACRCRSYAASSSVQFALAPFERAAHAVCPFPRAHVWIWRHPHRSSLSRLSQHSVSQKKGSTPLDPLARACRCVSEKSGGKDMASPLESTNSFAAWLLSLVGEELPLSVEKQSLVVSLLGLYVLFSLLLLALMLLFGVSCGEFFACFSCPSCCRGGDVETFVVLDEKTDIDHMAFRALAKAELVDGTPRLHTARGGANGYGARFEPIGGVEAFYTPSGAAQAHCPCAGDPSVYMTGAQARMPLSGRGLPMPHPTALAAPHHQRTADMQNRFGSEYSSVPATADSSKPPYTPMHTDTLNEMHKSGRTPQSQRSVSKFGAAGHGMEGNAPDDPRRQIMPATAAPSATGSPPSRFAARASPSPAPSSSRPGTPGGARPGTPSSRPNSARSSCWQDTVGWRDKDSPAWYGV